MDVGDAIEDEHGLDGKVPGTGTVGRRYDDGDAADDERHQGTADAEVGREIEAEEGQVVVQKVADPDADGEEGEQRDVAHVLQRDDALPDATQRGLHLIIYRELAQQQVQQERHSRQTDGHHQIACPRETVQDVVQVGTRLAEEGAEGAHLHQQHNAARHSV